MPTQPGDPAASATQTGPPAHPWRPALAAAALAALLAASLPAGASTPDWTLAKPEALVQGLKLPADIQVAPDGAVWFVEVAGNVSRHDPATGTTALVHHVEDVVTGTERGLSGFALAGDFAATGAYYLYYTRRTDDPDGGLNHLVRVARDGTETVLATVPGWKEHNGGRIAVAPDGTLFVGTGENQKRDPAQDPKSLLGKILHMTPDGQPVAGNLDGLVYSKGHRNPYGLALDPDTGELWETENSGWRRDEINLIKAGGNYGYPECEGHGLNGVDPPCPTDKGYTFPVRTFYEDHATAPTGATFWRGELYWASLNEGSIHHLWQDPGTQEWLDAVVLKHGKPLLDLAVGPDDALYFSTVNAIYRITLPDEDVPQTGSPDLRQAGGTGGAAQPPGGTTGRTVAAPSFALAAATVAAGLLARRRLVA